MDLQNLIKGTIVKVYSDSEQRGNSCDAKIIGLSGEKLQHPRAKGLSIPTNCVEVRYIGPCNFTKAKVVNLKFIRSVVPRTVKPTPQATGPPAVPDAVVAEVKRRSPEQRAAVSRATIAPRPPSDLHKELASMRLAQRREKAVEEPGPELQGLRGKLVDHYSTTLGKECLATIVGIAGDKTLNPAGGKYQIIPKDTVEIQYISPQCKTGFKLIRISELDEKLSEKQPPTDSNLHQARLQREELMNFLRQKEQQRAASHAPVEEPEPELQPELQPEQPVGSELVRPGARRGMGVVGGVSRDPNAFEDYPSNKYYRILGFDVPWNENFERSISDIRKEFHIKSKKAHPDHQGGNSDAFNKLKAAYDFLVIQADPVASRVGQGSFQEQLDALRKQKIIHETELEMLSASHTLTRNERQNQIIETVNEEINELDILIQKLETEVGDEGGDGDAMARATNQSAAAAMVEARAATVLAEEEAERLAEEAAQRRVAEAVEAQRRTEEEGMAVAKVQAVQRGRQDRRRVQQLRSQKDFDRLGELQAKGRDMNDEEVIEFSALSDQLKRQFGQGGGGKKRKKTRTKRKTRKGKSKKRRKSKTKRRR